MMRHLVGWLRCSWRNLSSSSPTHPLTHYVRVRTRYEPTANTHDSDMGSYPRHFLSTLFYIRRLSLHSYFTTANTVISYLWCLLKVRNVMASRHGCVTSAQLLATGPTVRQRRGAFDDCVSFSQKSRHALGFLLCIHHRGLTVQDRRDSVEFILGRHLQSVVDRCPFW
jgi:hypothetical protein